MKTTSATPNLVPLRGGDRGGLPLTPTQAPISKRSVAQIPALLLALLLGSSAMGDVLDNWTNRNSGVAADFRGLGFGKDTYVVLGTQGELLTSTNAINWISRDSGGTTWLSDVAYGNDTFVIVGQSGKILTSTEGVSWTPRLSGTTAGFSDVQFINGQFIAVGNRATIATSPDGINWTLRDSGIADTNSLLGTLYTLAYGNGVYVISGQSSTVLTSSNTMHWSQREAGASGTVVYGNGRFLIVGYQNANQSVLLTSLDGVAWTNQGSVAKQSFRTTFRGNYVGVGGDTAHGIPGFIMASSDGTNWIPRKSGLGSNLWNVKYVAGTFMAVGENGTILQTGFFEAVPEISGQPVNQTILSGSNVTFNVFAFGSPPLNYQWFFNSTNLLAWATNSSLILSNATWNQTGLYSAQVSNSLGSITSSNALVIVVDSTDTDLDGIPNYWEIQYGLDFNNPSDATNPVPSGLFTYLQKFVFGLNPLTNDTDGDGLSDYDELFVHATSPLKTDTDGDGMPDSWEVQHGLNGRFNDAADDLDGDGLSNLAEYNWSLSHPSQLIDPRTKYSTSVTVSDFAVVTGTGTNQFFYDRNNRLTGAEFDRGLALAYVYDGNDNLVRQVSMKHDANTNGLPDVWEFLNGLTNNASAYTDTDGDGWTDYQEWKAGTNPRDPQSAPNLLGNPGINIASLTLPFTPSNFVVGVGQLDGLGAEEIVLGADGNPGTNVNFLLVLTQTLSGWSTQRVDVGAFGITSIAVGEPTNRPSAGIYVGLRGTTNGSGRVMEFTGNGGLWQSNLVVLSTNQAAFVLGVRGQDVLVSLATTNSPDGSLSAMNFTTNWNLSLIDTSTSHRGLGTMNGSSQAPQGSLRLLDGGGIQYGGIQYASNELIAYYPFNGGASDQSGNGHDGTLHSATPTQDRFGSGGQALLFDGVQSFVSVPDSASLRLSASDFTISAWILLTARNSISDCIISKRSTGSQDGWIFSVDNAGHLNYSVSGGADPLAISMNVLSLGQWHHVAIVYRGNAQSLAMFIDTAGDSTTSSIPTPNPGTSVDLHIGHDSANAAGGYFFHGKIDDLRIYNKALNGQEIAAASAIIGITIPEPSATRTNNWHGGSLASGLLRGTSGSSVFYTFTDDKNANGLSDFADDFVTAEYLVSGTNASLLTISRQPIAALTVAQSYGLASVNFLNASNDVFFTGEPDGQVFAWTASGATNPLQRQLFSGHHAGKAWHALAGVKTFEPGEGLIGLRVDPVSPNKCDVIFWSPQSQLAQLANLPNTAPAAAVLPATNTLGSLALVTVRLWDAEGNASTPFLQYQLSGSTNWQNAALVNLDGGAYSASTRVAALPGGTNHTIVWNAQADLGSGVITNVLLRSRASDFALLGDWSAGTPFNVQTSTTPDSDNDGLPDAWEMQFFSNLSHNGLIDSDGDGVLDVAEYIADTNPTNSQSYLHISGATPLPGAVRIQWQGGIEATQYLQRLGNLNATNWLNISTSLPPTPISGSYTDSFGTNAMQFYRVKVTR